MAPKKIYNVMSWAPGVGVKWVHASNLAANGRGGYEPVTTRLDGLCSSIRWFDFPPKTRRRRK